MVVTDVGADGSLRSNRVLCQLAGQYAIDMFIGSTLQMDTEANSSTVTEGRLSGFGGAPNMGHDPHGRRHATPAWLDLHHGEGAGLRGRKLVVQIVETFQSSGTPTFVESLAHNARRAAGVARRARSRIQRAHRAHRRSPGVDGEARRHVPVAPGRTRRLAGRAPPGGRDLTQRRCR